MAAIDVGIRLKVEGGSQVRAELAGLGQAGRIMADQVADGATSVAGRMGQLGTAITSAAAHAEAADRRLSAQLGSTGRQRTDHLQILHAETDALFDANDAQERRNALMDEGARLTRDMRTPQEQYADELHRLQQLVEAGAISWTTYERAETQALDHMNTALGDHEDAWASLAKAIEGSGKQSAGALANWVVNAKGSFEDVARSFEAEILQRIFYNSVTGPLADAASAGISAIGSSLGNALFASAKGNVFAPDTGGPRHIAFAQGGVFDRPVTFPMAGGRTGLMAEAGEEAIMPLRRNAAGRLGVEAQLRVLTGPSSLAGDRSAELLERILGALIARPEQPIEIRMPATAADEQDRPGDPARLTDELTAGIADIGRSMAERFSAGAPADAPWLDRFRPDAAGLFGPAPRLPGAPTIGADMPAPVMTYVIEVDARGASDPTATAAAVEAAVEAALTRRLPGIVKASAELAHGRVVDSWTRLGGRFNA
jgi:hypothetical protein